MATRGNSNQIIVGAAQLFVSKQGALEFNTANSDYRFSSGSANAFPALSGSGAYADLLETASASVNWRNLGFTMNGLELQFQPDFGEVQVDQLLDVAKLYKQGMQVNMVTAFAEATLENLVVAIASPTSVTSVSASVNASGRLTSGEFDLSLSGGEIGDVPVERALIAVGPGSGDPLATGNAKVERVYIANRVLSIENVTVSAKRDEASMFEVTFRLLPASNGVYGKIVDRTVG